LKQRIRERERERERERATGTQHNETDPCRNIVAYLHR